MFFILIVETAYTQDKIIAKDLTKKELRFLKRKKAFEKQKFQYEKRVSHQLTLCLKRLLF